MKEWTLLGFVVLARCGASHG